MYTYLARLSLMLLPVGYIGKDLAAEFTRRPPRDVGVHGGVEAGVSHLHLLFRGRGLAEADPATVRVLGDHQRLPSLSLELDVMHNAHCCTD